MATEIKDRNDVSLLVTSFYKKVRSDDDIGPIFNNLISDWEAHLEKLTDFWTMNLFGNKLYHGNPVTAHQHADDVTGEQISPYHFGTWLNHWYATIDEYFEGENADILKRRAQKMQGVLMMKIFEHRQKK